jgi:hypothetical protein
MSNPAPALMPAAMMNVKACPSRAISEQMSGNANVAPKMASNDPNTCATPSTGYERLRH